MMKFKKFLAAAMTGAMMFGMVATAAPAVSAQAGISTKLGTSDTMIFHAAVTQAEVPTGSSIYKKMEITVQSNDPFVIVKFYKDAENLNKVSGTYTYPTNGGKVTIDLGGFYKPGNKEACVVCYGSSNTEVPLEGYTFTLGKAAEKLKIKVNKNETECAKVLGIDAAEFANYSYRSLYGTEWQSLEVFKDNYDSTKVAGTTIVIRKNATETTPASTEAKVKISGMTKAPTLKITYEKDQIKVKNMDLAVMEGTKGFCALGEAAYTPVKVDMKFEDLVKFAKEAGMSDSELASPFTIIVRTNKNEKFSMPSIYTLTPPPVLEKGTTVTTGSAIAVTSGSSITVEGTAKRNKTELKFTVKNDNGTNYEYEYSLDNGKNWKKVSAKAVSITGDKILVRVAGQKAPRNDTDPAPRFPSKGVELTISVSKEE